MDHVQPKPLDVAVISTRQVPYPPEPAAELEPEPTRSPPGANSTTRVAAGAETPTLHGSKQWASATENVNDFVDELLTTVVGAGAAVVAVVPVVATGGFDVPAVVAGVGGGGIAVVAGGTDEVVVDAATDVVVALVVEVDVVEADSTRPVVVGALVGATMVVLTTAAPSTS